MAFLGVVILNSVIVRKFVIKSSQIQSIIEL